MLQTAFGPLDPALDLASLGHLHLGTFDKSTFSMVTPDIENILRSRPAIKNVVIFGIAVSMNVENCLPPDAESNAITKSHVCVLHTVLDLLSSTITTERYTPFVIADCIASHNRWEVPIAIERMRQEGARITTSESLVLELLSTAGHPQFRTFWRLINGSVEATEKAGRAMVLGQVTTPTNYAKL